MAWNVSLGVECGPSEAAARAAAAHFDEYVIVMASGKRLECGAGVWQDSEGNWWAAVFPGISAPGTLELRTAQSMSEVGRALYRRLEDAPAFRFALFGVEAHDWSTYGELDQWDLVNVDGLVVADEVWVRCGSPPQCVSFRSGYKWTPYAGEKQDL